MRSKAASYRLSSRNRCTMRNCERRFAPLLQAQACNACALRRPMSPEGAVARDPSRNADRCDRRHDLVAPRAAPDATSCRRKETRRDALARLGAANRRSYSEASLIADALPGAYELEWYGCSTFRFALERQIVMLDAYVDRVRFAPPTGIT